MRPSAGLLHAGLAADSTSAARTAPVFERHAFPLPQNIFAVEALDANGDGKRDLTAVGQTKVWALLAPSWKVVELADTAGGGTIHAIALDADGDGDLDLDVAGVADPGWTGRLNVIPGVGDPGYIASRIWNPGRNPLPEMLSMNFLPFGI